MFYNLYKYINNILIKSFEHIYTITDDQYIVLTEINLDYSIAENDLDFPICNVVFRYKVKFDDEEHTANLNVDLTESEDYNIGFCAAFIASEIEGV